MTSAVRSIGIALLQVQPVAVGAQARTAAQDKALCVLFSGSVCRHVMPLRQAGICIDHRHSDLYLKRGLLGLQRVEIPVSMVYADVQMRPTHPSIATGTEEKMTLKFQ